MTDEQKIQRNILMGWYTEIRYNVIEHLNRDTDTFEKYFDHYSKSTPQGYCDEIVIIIGDSSVTEWIYNYLDDLFTYKQYMLYFQMNEEYEYCVNVQYCINSLFEHIKHLIECCNETEGIKGGMHLLFAHLWDSIEKEWTATYGE